MRRRTVFFFFRAIFPGRLSDIFPFPPESFDEKRSVSLSFSPSIQTFFCCSFPSCSTYKNSSWGLLLSFSQSPGSSRTNAPSSFSPSFPLKAATSFLFFLPFDFPLLLTKLTTFFPLFFPQSIVRQPEFLSFFFPLPLPTGSEIPFSRFSFSLFPLKPDRHAYFLASLSRSTTPSLSVLSFLPGGSEPCAPSLRTFSSNDYGLFPAEEALFSLFTCSKPPFFLLSGTGFSPPPGSKLFLFFLGLRTATSPHPFFPPLR